MNGAARKEMNANASSKFVERAIVGTNEDTVFVRVVRMMGFGHARVLAQGSNGTRELLARIPKNKFGKKGATPITLNSVVSIFVGKDFDASVKTVHSEHFDITSILDDRQARDLVSKKVLPAWMLKSADEIASGVGITKTTEDDEGFDWEVSDEAEDVAGPAQTLGVALTKKEMREAVKTKSRQGVKVSKSSEDDEVDADVDTEPVEVNEEPHLPMREVRPEVKVASDAKWAALGVARSLDAMIDRI